MPPDIRKIVDDAGRHAWDEARTAAQAGNEAAVTKMQSLGVQFTTPDLAPFRQAVKPFIAEWAERTDSTALVAEIEKAVKA